MNGGGYEKITSQMDGIAAWGDDPKDQPNVHLLCLPFIGMANACTYFIADLFVDSAIRVQSSVAGWGKKLVRWWRQAIEQIWQFDSSVLSRNEIRGPFS